MAAMGGFKSFEACSRASDSSNAPESWDANPRHCHRRDSRFVERACRRFRCSQAAPSEGRVSPDHLQCHGPAADHRGDEIRRPGNTLPNPVSQATLLEAFHRYTSLKKNRTTSVTFCETGKAILHHFGETRPLERQTPCRQSRRHYRGPRSNQSTALLDLDRPVGDAAGLSEHQACIHGKRRTCGGATVWTRFLLESYMQKDQRIFACLAGFREYASNTTIFRR